jgi:hypothetical protein
MLKGTVRKTVDGKVKISQLSFTRRIITQINQIKVVDVISPNSLFLCGLIFSDEYGASD